jgi:hypothetical protein
MQPSPPALPSKNTVVYDPGWPAMHALQSYYKREARHSQPQRLLLVLVVLAVCWLVTYGAQHISMG